MHIAYSALRKTTLKSYTNKKQVNEQFLLRYKAYQKVCNKYSSEIADIQKHLPGWAPALPDVK